MAFSLIDRFFPGVAIIASRCDYIGKVWMVDMGSNRVALTASSSLAVYPDRQTFSARVGTSQRRQEKSFARADQEKSRLATASLI